MCNYFYDKNCAFGLKIFVVKCQSTQLILSYFRYWPCICLWC